MVSIKNNDGVDEIGKYIANKFRINEINIDNETIITNSRHKQLIMKSSEQTRMAIETIKNSQPIDIIAIYLKEAMEDLGEITGENVSEGIISSIFKKFCLGK